MPKFKAIFLDFGITLPEMTLVLIQASDFVVDYFWTIPLIPFAMYVVYKLIRKFRRGRFVVDWMKLRVPIFGNIGEKVIVARTMRTLGTLVASGVPILESLIICRDTSQNAVFERA